MAYFCVFDAIRTSWRELFNCLQGKEQLKLCKYICNERYVYSSLSESEIPFETFNIMVDCLDIDHPHLHFLNDFDVSKSDIGEIDKFLSTVKEIFESNKLMDEELLIERRDHFTHSSRDEQAMDIEEVQFKQEDLRAELRNIAIGLGLQNYQIHNFIRVRVS